MFSLFDIEGVCRKEGGAEKFLEKKGIIMDGKSFSQCGGPLHQLMFVNGVTKYRCCADRKCHLKRVKNGSLLYTDGAKAYESLSPKYGLHHQYVDHQKGEFVRKQHFKGKMRTISTQGIDGLWDRMKTFLRSRGGTLRHHLETNVKEYQWRTNLKASDDPFLLLLSDISKGYFQ